MAWEDLATEVTERKMDRTVMLARGFRGWLAASALVFVPAAHGVVVLDNIGSPPYSSAYAVHGTQSVAMSFLVGTDADLWVLDEVSMVLSAGNTSPAQDFLVELRADSGGVPGGVLGVLSGPSDPAVLGTYQFTPGTDLLLTGGERYWLAARSPGSVDPDYYTWVFDPPGVESGLAGWSVGADPAGSSDQGANWVIFQGLQASMFSLSASPIPEPGRAGLIGMGLVLLAGRRRGRRGCRGARA